MSNLEQALTQTAASEAKQELYINTCITRVNNMRDNVLGITSEMDSTLQRIDGHGMDGDKLEKPALVSSGTKQELDNALIDLDETISNLHAYKNAFARL